jgi:uncharacterized protein (UPF0276 family)
MTEIHASLSFNLDASLIQAALPLFAAEEVDGLEWSFDTLYKQPEVPDWLEELFRMYGSAGRLVGHGVYFSLFSGKWLPEQAQWLAALQGLSKKYRFDHITEHFGFLTGEDFHKGAPLSVPYSAQTLAIGQDRLLRIADACGCPVGLENLAFAPDRRAAEVHGDFLEALLAPVNGFVILDLHNLYCQLHNFGLDAGEMLAAFPLHLVREIHISGGSWEPSPHRAHPGVRRDTHDDRVPEAVFELLEQALPRCPHLKFVVMEQLGHAVATEQSQSNYREDFRRMRALVQQESLRRSQQTSLQSIHSFAPPIVKPSATPLEDAALFQQQRLLSDILETSASLPAVEEALQKSALADSAWGMPHWDLAMLETAWRIARKWKHGF